MLRLLYAKTWEIRREGRPREMRYAMFSNFQAHIRSYLTGLIDDGDCIEHRIKSNGRITGKGMSRYPSIYHEPLNLNARRCVTSKGNKAQREQTHETLYSSFVPRHSRMDFLKLLNNMLNELL